MQRNHTVLTCVYGVFVVAICCITYVAFYKSLAIIYFRRESMLGMKVRVKTSSL
jgi:hypothetical protein